MRIKKNMKEDQGNIPVRRSSTELDYRLPLISSKT